MSRGGNRIGVLRYYDVIPAELKRFLIKAFMLFVLWRVAYFFILQPTDFPDKQLIDLVLAGTRQLLLPFYGQVLCIGDTIVINGRSALTVYKQCNGLDMMATYLGFLLSLPVNKSKLLLFAVGAPVIIYLLNLLRCFLLAILFYKGFQPHSFTHHQLFELFIYGFTFLMWGWYCKGNTSSHS
ncbi:MAG: hypothetical protein EOP56_12530 [Sphingobacteriales bacterium]|nr:MAG: hypothetical protein EOP56_12530 [Sphingobacteriales bacterium]